MNKNFLFLLFVLAVLLVKSVNAQYCAPTYTSGCEYGDGLTQVQLNTISQAIPCSGIPNYYHDYSSTSTNLAKNGYYILSGQSNNSVFYISVWIDYNNNMTFENGEELIGSFSFNSPGGTFSVPITIPGTVGTGATRIRVMSSVNSMITNPCTDPGPGNSCDFTVNIVTPVTPPTVITQGATGVTSSTAVMNGSVNAHDNLTHVEFHYGLDLSYGNTINSVPAVVTGNSATNVSSFPVGLLPNTTYHYRVVGYGPGGYIDGGDITFTTDALPAPTVATISASNVTGTSAMLNGTVNAHDAASVVTFEYGIDITYGRTVDGTPATVNSNSPETITAPISGLAVNTTYHYRIISTNAAGTSYGEDMIFTTLPSVYCIPVYSTGCNSYNMGLTYFGLNTISQSISCSGSPNYYHDFTSTSTELALNGSYSVTVQAGGGYGVYITIWIDYNKNNLFDGGAEIVGQGHCYGGASSTIPITISATALTGPTGLRAMTRYDYYGYPSDPCSTSEIYGNCSDFTVNILSGAAFASVATEAASDINGSGAGLNATVNANGFATVVYFDYGLTALYGSSIMAIPGTVTGYSPTAVYASIAGLLPYTLYHFRARGSNAGGITIGDDVTFTTSPIAPIVSTSGATLVTGVSAMLNGTVNPNNSSSSISFEYGLTTAYGTTLAGDPSAVLGYSAQASSAAIAGLELNTTYHFRVLSTNEAGTSHGNDMTFTTLAAPYCIPIYSTGCNYYNMGLSYFGLNTIDQPISCSGSPSYYHDFTSSSTDLMVNGSYSISVQAGGGYGQYIMVWIDYNQNGVFDVASEMAGQGHCNGGGSNTIPFTVSGSASTGPTWLRAMTRYDYYGYPSDPCSVSEIYGNCSDFTVNILSDATSATISTLAASGITGSGAALNGNVNANGHSTIAFFDYGLTASYGITLPAIPGIISGSSPTDITAAISGLLPNTLYHFRARGSNAGGITLGDDVTFTTSQTPPIVSTGSATLITGISATLTGNVNANNSPASTSFEYGLTTSYGTTVTGNPASVSGYNAQSVTAPIAGLSLNTTYHYRVTGTNDAGTTVGDDMTFTTLSAPYCIPVYSSGCYYYNMGLTYFGLNTISQQISCSGSPTYYHDFTSTSTDLVLNGSYSISVQAGGGYGQGITIWIDYNQNGLFDGVSEIVGQGYCAGSSSATIPITVSGTALTGTTWLRAMTRYDYYGQPSDPCSVTEIYGNCSDFSVNILESAALSTATTTTATDIIGSAATLNGTINANGFTASVFFDFGLTSAYGTILTGTPSLIPGSSPTDASAAVSGLIPNTLYHFRIRSSNAGGITLGEDLTFTSSPVPPTVSTGGVNAVGGSYATLNGTVDANNSTSSVSFEYGLDATYGSTVDGNPLVVNGHTPQPSSVQITGLTTNTTYHYRIVSSNVADTTYGNDMTFSTLATPYCIPVYSNGCNYYNMGLTYFELNSISQAISCSGSPSYYHDFTSSSTELALNGTYSISVQAGGSYGVYVKVWIDFNRNNIFDGTDEIAGQGHCYGGSASIIPISVSPSAVPGTAGLRIMTRYDYYGYPSDPCSANEVYGNCSDFTVNIVPAVPPIVSTVHATSISGSSATMNGLANAKGFSTDIIFEYGLTSSYGSMLTGTPSPVTGGIATNITGLATGLLANTTYHYRLSGTSSTGTVTGDDMTFTTLSSTATQAVTSAMNLGATNQQILGIEVLNPNPSNPLAVTSFTFNTNGSTQLSDLSNAKLYYTGTSGVFATAAQYGSEVTDFGAPGSSFSITGSQALSTGNNHFWLTYDISPTATGGDYADAECTSITAGTAMTPAITAPEGSRQITDDKFLESVQFVQASTDPVLKGSDNNEILMLDFHVTGTTSTLPLNSIVITNTGFDGDISAGGVSLYTTATPVFSTSEPLGTAQSFNSKSAVFSSLSYDLPTGHTYIWVAFNIASGATGFHFADGKFAQNSINVNGILYPATEQNPSGNRLITVAPKALPLLESTWATIPPADWNKIGTTWFSSLTNFAGGTANELKVDYAGCLDGDKMVTPPLIATGLPYMVLRFKNYLNNFGAGCTLRVQSSADGNTWTNEAWSLQPGSGGLFGPYDVVTTINSNLAGGSTYVAFAVTGNPNSINDWYIDNVKITAPEAPTVFTIAASSVTGNSAVTGGDVTDDAANPVTERGVCWSTLSNPTILDDHTSDGTGLGIFASSISGLDPGTTYHIRAFATNGIGTAYGADQYFTTLGANVFNVSGGGTFCTGGSGLSVGLDGSDVAATYQLYKDASAYGSAIAGTGSALSWDNLNDGTYTVEAITAFGTTIMIGNAVISSYNNPVSVSIVSTAVTTCPGTAITYTATPVNGGALPAFQWKVNNIDVGTNSDQFTYMPNGGDQVRCVLNSNIDCPSGNLATSNTITMILAVPSPNIYGSVSECAGATGVTYSTDAGGGILNYSWAVSSGGTITAGGGNTSSVTVTWNTTGPQSVSVNYTNTFGCTAAVPTVKNVTVNPLPVPSISGATSACTGSAGNVYATESGKSNYAWTVSAGGTITAGGNSYSNTATITWNTAGAHSVSVNYYDANGCTATAPTTLNITVNPLPAPPLAGPVQVCAGATGNTYTTNAAMIDYSWAVSTGGTITSGGSSTDNTITVTWNTTGSKTVSVNYINSFGCTATLPGSIAVTVDPMPTATLGGPVTVCTGSAGNIYSTESGKTNYIWNVSAGGTVTAGGSATYNSVTVTWNTSGPQTVSANYTGSGGCSPVSPTLINVSVNELPSVSITGNAAACEGDTVTYAASVTNGGTNPAYHWYVNGVPALSSYCGGALSSGLIAYYPFNASASDASGNGKNGTVTGATLTSDRFGNPNSAYSFNGSGNHISIPVDINVSTRPQLTMLAWVKPLLVNPIRTIISHDNGSFDRSLTIDNRGSGTGYSCYRGSGVLGSFPAITNEWVQVAVKYDQPTNTATLYSNTSSISGTTSLNTGWNYTWIGGNPSYGEYFGGVIDDVRLYNRLLTNDEITALFNNNINESTFCYIPADGDLLTCVVTNDAGCSGTSNAITMSVLPSPVPTVSGPATACQNSVANTYTTESGKADYAWSVSSGGTVTGGGTSADNSITVTWTNAGAQSVGVNYSNTNLCNASSPAIFAVSVNALPVPSISGSSTVCGIPSIGASYSTEAGMSGYSWTVSEGGSITSGSGTNSIAVSWTTTGAKTVTVTYLDSHGCTPASATVKNVDVYALPVPSIMGPSTLCGLPSTGNIYVTEAGMTAYAWTVSAGGVITSGAGTHSIAVTWNTSGAKTVTVTYAQNGCSAASPASYQVDVNTFITPTISGPTSSCGIPSAGNTYTTEAGMTNYQWAVSTGGTITSGGSPADDFVTVDWTTAGTKNVTVNYTNGVGCTAISPIVKNINVYSLPVPTISGSSTICGFPSAGHVYSTEAGMSDYVWNVSAGGAITSGATTNSITVTWNIPGLHTVDVTYLHSNGCTPASPGVLPLYVYGAPIATIAGPSSVCGTPSAGSIYSTETSMTAYSWTLSAGGYIASGSGTSAITVVWTTAGAKTVSVTYLDGNGCSPASPAVQATNVYSYPVATISGNGTVCGIPSPGNTYTTEAGMTNYIWTVSSGGSITAGGTSGDNSVTVNWTSAGARTVTVNYTDGNGCTLASPVSRTVQVEAVPVATITGSALICGIPSAGNTYSTQSGMTGYIWSVSSGGSITSGSGTNSIHVTWSSGGPQTVSVDYTTSYGCAAAAPASINVDVNAFVASAISGPTGMCGLPSAGNVYSTDAGMTGYTWTVSSGGTISSGAGTNAITVTWASAGAKTVTVTYTDGNGCSPASPVIKNVDVYALPVPVISGSASICDVPSAGNMYSTEAGMTGYAWNVSSGGSITAGQGTNSITVTWNTVGAQTVDVVYTNSHSCTAAAATIKNVSVNLYVPVSLTISATANPSCAGATITYTAAPVNGGASPAYQWKVNGTNAGWNSATFWYVPVDGDLVACTVNSSLPCTTGNPATSNTITMTVNAHPDAPVSGGNQTVCATTLPALLGATAPAGSTTDWYSQGSGGSLLLSNNSVFSTSSAGNYYAESRNLTTGCKSTSRTAVNLTVNTAIQYYIDLDGDGYGNPEVSVFDCSQPLGYVANALDCNDNNANINPADQYFAYTGNAGFTSSLVSPAIGSSYTLFHFEADYFDATNSLPGSGYPRLILDYEGNGSYTDANDRVIIMTASNPLDISTDDGKRYFAEVNGLAYGTSWRSRIVTSGDAGCLTTFGPFDYPDVLHEPNVYLFANDISFSVPHPDPAQNIAVMAVVHNESDFDAQNFVCHLVNQWDTLIAYPDIMVANLPAHQSTTVQWNITTPAVPAWCPMQVTVDYTDVLAENNELDNTAVRPFVNGNYQVAGSIVVQSVVSPSVSYSNQYTYLSLSGRAWYTDLAVQLNDSTVAGATVEFTVTETGATYSGYTNSWGYFNIYFPAPDTPGVYHITGSVTDFTLTRDFTNEFTILAPIVPITKPNLTLNYCHSVDIQPVDPHLGATVTLVAHVSNNGDAKATGPIEVRFTYSTGGSWLGSYAGDLLAGQSAVVSVTAPTPPLSTTVLYAEADPNHTVDEWNETYADNSSIDDMCYEFQPVGICGGNFWGTHCVNTSTGIYIGLNVSHLYDASQVPVLFEVNRPGVAGWQTLGTGYLNNATRNCYCPYVVSLPDAFTYTELGTYTFRITVDPNNLYPECEEGNNVLTVTSTSVTCIVVPPEIRANLTFIQCKGLEVQPVNPLFPGMATLVANVVNNGNDVAYGPIDVEFTYSGGTFTGTLAGNLSPGQSAAITVIAPLPVPATTILTASIDPLNTIVEWSDLDNTTADDMCWEFQPVPHCGVNFWTHTYLTGQSATLSIGVNIQHLYDANPLKVRFEVSGPGIAGTMNLGNAILNNATRNCYCPWGVVLPMPYTFFEPGTYHFTITTDPDNDYTECDETNNVLQVDVIVIEGADMRILSQFINPDPLNPAVNDSVSLIVSYENIGNSNVNDQMKLRVIVDNTMLDEVYPLSGLATGDHASVAIPTKWATDLPGAHVIRAIIDADNQVPEINESNNEATRAIIVGECANLYFQLFAASNSNPAQGGYIHINARIGNAGDVNATATVKFYYLSDAGDTVSFGQSSISVFLHDSTSIIMPWLVADASTTLIGKIVDVNVQEFNPDDNMATDLLGGFNISLASVPACNNANNGTLTASVTGGNAPFFYLWNTGYIGETLTAGAGEYTVTVTDNTGLSIDATGTIATTATGDPSLTGSSSVCINTAGVVYSTEAGMSNYSWIVPSGALVTAGGSSADNTLTLTWLEAGNHTITVSYTSTNGCASTATNYVVSVNPIPVPALTGPASACVTSGGNVYTTEAGMSSYAWTVSSGGTITAGGTSQSNTITVTWNTVGAQTVSASYSSAGGCAALGSTVYNVAVNPLPVPVITGPASVCASSSGNIYSTEAGMTAYNWSISAGGTITAGAGTYMVTVSWNKAGAKTISVNYANANNCSATMPSTYAVTVNPSATSSVSVSPSLNNVCVGTSVMFTAIPVGGGDAPTYQWYKNNAAISTATGATYTYVPINDDVVYVAMTSNASCSSGSPINSNTVTMVVNSPVTPSVSIAASANPVASGTVVTFTPTPVNGGSPTYQWFVNNIYKASGATYSFIPVNGDAVKAVMATSLTCVTTAVATSNIVTISIPSTTWTGAISSAWLNAANWSNGVPGALTSVIVPAGVPNFPTLTSAATCANITINHGGSFIGSEFLTVTSATVKRTLSNNLWHYMSSPVVTATFAGVFNNSVTVWAKEFNPVTNSWVYKTGGQPFVVGKGYSVGTSAPPVTATFTGTLNRTPVTSSLLSNNGGWNLLGNPFQSAINWDNVVKGTGVGAAVYVWTGSNYVTWTSGVGGALTGGIIPAQDGFFVTTTVTGSTITIPLAARVHSAIPYYKENDENLLEIQAYGNDASDRMFVHFNKDATPAYDYQYDAMKLYGEDYAPQLFSIIPDNALSINELPLAGNETVEVGFKCSTTGEYSLTASGMESFDASMPIVLEDKKFNIFQDLRTKPEYSFSYVADENANRFKLHFKAATGTTPTDSEITVYSYERNVIINNPTGLAGEVWIYDITGRELIHNDLSSQMKTSIPVQATTGNYMVKVVTAKASVIQKVFIW